MVIRKIKKKMHQKYDFNVYHMSQPYCPTRHCIDVGISYPVITCSI